MSNIAENLSTLRRQIDAATRASHRDPASVQLIAVSKTKGIEAVREALVAGQRVFGENRVQEAATKFPVLREDYPQIELHLIGPLQTNKVEAAVRLFDAIHTVDRPKLAEALAKAIQKIGRSPRLFVEINIGREPQKAGLMPEALPEFLAYCCKTLGLVVQGLMCIPPYDAEPTPFFQHLKDLADHHQLTHLSMGMSRDFEAAIKCGATEVRVGSALFGERSTL